MTATLHDLLKSYREGGVFPSYDQLAAIAGQDQIGAAVRGNVRSGCPCEPLGLDGAVCPDPKTGLPLCSSADCYSAKPVAAVRGEAVAESESHPAWSRVILYTDSIRGKQTCRDDLWAITGDELRALLAAKLSARAADAPSEPSESLCAAVMNIPCERTMSHFVSQAEMRTYREGHRDALCATIDVIAATKSRAADALDSQPGADEPSEREALIACLGDDAVTLLRANPDDEMAQTMREAAAMLENDGKALDSQPTDGGVRNGSDLDAVHAFLMGESPLEGVQFGDKHPIKAGAHWWRLNLRAALAKG